MATAVCTDSLRHGDQTLGEVRARQTCCEESHHTTTGGCQRTVPTPPADLRLPSTMRACQIVRYNSPHELRTIPTPSVASLREHDLLLKVVAASLCHSDLEYVKGHLDCTLPVTASHEATGTVIAVGCSVTKFEIGARIMAGQTFGRCGSCQICRGPENYRHYCPHRETMMSVQRNGAFQEYLVVDAREASRIPDEMPFEIAAPLACAGTTVWRGILQTQLKPGQWLGIVGSGGGLGHLGIQFAKARGLKVIGVDARKEGIALSREAGSDVVLDARLGKEYVARCTYEATGGAGVDATLNVSDAKTAAATACAMTKNHGTVIQIALVSRQSYCVPLPFILQGTDSQCSLQKSLYRSLNSYFEIFACRVRFSARH
jgi:alcohol dehydrogenase, propanol-preferring